MDERLYVNGSLVELKENSVARSLQINDFSDVKDRQANYSNSINIPKTPKNKQIFNFLGLLGSTTRIPYEVINIKYVLDGIELVTNGKGVIKNTDTNNFSLVIYDGNISMTDLLGTSTLADLDFATLYNHNLSYSSFFNSMANTSGYIYGTNGSASLSIGQTVPSFYIHTLMDMIFTQKGWTLAGAILTDADYKSRVTTMDIGFNQTLTPSITPVTGFPQIKSTNYTASYGVNTTDDILSDTYIVTADSVVKVSFTGSITTVTGFPEIRIKVNGVLATILPSLSDEFSIYVLTGDIITVYISVTTQFTNPNYVYDITQAYTTIIDSDDSYYTIVFSDLIGSKKQIDLVKDVMQRFGLLFRKTPHKNEIEFITSELLLSSTATADDWSSKFSDKVSESYTSDYAQDNVFKYNYDESDNDFADGHLAVTNVNLQINKTALTTMFKATVLNGVYQMTYFDSAGVPKQDGLRIFKITIVNKSLGFVLKTGYSNIITKTLNIADLDFSALLYQTELTNNYTIFNNMLNNYKEIVVNCNLSIIDIYQLDFYKLKYFKQLGRYFYLNKVVNFKNNEVTKVELIQIPL